jgi:hypothetical protein
MKNLRSAMCVAGAIIAVVVLVSVFTGCSNENEVTMKEQTSLSMDEGFLDGLRKLSQVQPVVTRGAVGDSVYISVYAEQLSQEYQELVAQYDIMADLTEEETGRMHATDEEFEQMALDDDLFWKYIDKCKT